MPTTRTTREDLRLNMAFFRWVALGTFGGYVLRTWDDLSSTSNSLLISCSWTKQSLTFHDCGRMLHGPFYGQMKPQSDFGGMLVTLVVTAHQSLGPLPYSDLYIPLYTRTAPERHSNKRAIWIALCNRRNPESLRTDIPKSASCELARPEYPEMPGVNQYYFS